MRAFTLYADGTVTGSENDTIKTLDKSKTYELFKKAESLTQYKFQEPQNMYSFIELRGKDIKNRITWGPASDVKQEAADLYQQLKPLGNL